MMSKVKKSRVSADKGVATQEVEPDSKRTRGVVVSKGSSGGIATTTPMDPVDIDAVRPGEEIVPGIRVYSSGGAAANDHASSTRQPNVVSKLPDERTAFERATSLTSNLPFFNTDYWSYVNYTNRGGTLGDRASEQVLTDIRRELTEKLKDTIGKVQSTQTRKTCSSCNCQGGYDFIAFDKSELLLLIHTERERVAEISCMVRSVCKGQHPLNVLITFGETCHGTCGCIKPVYDGMKTLRDDSRPTILAVVQAVKFPAKLPKLEDNEETEYRADVRKVLSDADTVQRGYQVTIGEYHDLAETQSEVIAAQNVIIADLEGQNTALRTAIAMQCALMGPIGNSSSNLPMSTRDEVEQTAKSCRLGSKTTDEQIRALVVQQIRLMNEGNFSAIQNLFKTSDMVHENIQTDNPTDANGSTATDKIGDKPNLEDAVASETEEKDEDRPLSPEAQTPPGGGGRTQTEELEAMEAMILAAHASDFL